MKWISHSTAHSWIPLESQASVKFYRILKSTIGRTDQKYEAFLVRHTPAHFKHVLWKCHVDLYWNIRHTTCPIVSRYPKVLVNRAYLLRSILAVASLSINRECMKGCPTTVVVRLLSFVVVVCDLRWSSSFEDRNVHVYSCDVSRQRPLSCFINDFGLFGFSCFVRRWERLSLSSASGESFLESEAVHMVVKSTYASRESWKAYQFRLFQLCRPHLSSRSVSKSSDC